MDVSGCSSGLVATAVFAILLLPAHYYVPDLYSLFEEPLQTKEALHENRAIAWISDALLQCPPLDLLLSILLLLSAVLTYVYEWIQRKLMERRVVQLNRYLGASLERLRVWDTEQEQLEATLKMHQHATSEYNLLLYLLLRQHNWLAGPGGPPSNCFFDNI